MSRFLSLKSISLVLCAGLMLSAVGEIKVIDNGDTLQNPAESTNVSEIIELNVVAGALSEEVALSQTATSEIAEKANNINEQISGIANADNNSNATEAVPASLKIASADSVERKEDIRGNDDIKIDATNIQDGYVRVSYSGRVNKLVKVIVKGSDDVSYVYNINQNGEYETFPLSSGNGAYTVGIYKNISGTTYSTLYKTAFTATLSSPFAPYLESNQYVNYADAKDTVAFAQQLTAGQTSDIEKIQTIYNWIINNVSYDKEKINNVKTGYLPDLDSVLAERKGICFDYASLMAGMLRSQGIPCKLVIGYSGNVYHAWVSVYTNETGWINGTNSFDGYSWELLDPTFASTGNQSRSIMEYIGNGKNYAEKYNY